MYRIRLLAICWGLFLSISVGSAAFGQAQPDAKVRFPPRPPRWRDSIINARGNRPNLERKPRLRRIADPANLEKTITPAALDTRPRKRAR